MPYRAPVDDILFAMTHAAGLAGAIEEGTHADLADGFAASILGEAAKFAEGILAPMNRAGDKAGAKFDNGHVTTVPGWSEAYHQWAEAGWNGLAAPQEHGGMGLPQILSVGCMEIWSAANMAFGLCPMLTAGAIEALVAHGSPHLQATYLEKLVSGAWTGTMNLTEPQAGSDLSALRSKAVPAGDGTYKITGQKIYITYGEHDMTDNIIHLVLARLPDAPAGTRGISLFLVPKFLVNPDGTLGAHNDVRCAGIEHKMGIHASPTCTMVFGDAGGATGWLVGQENKGLACMFTMMNSARLNVGVQGVAIADRATQHALAYAQDRRQGRTSDAKGPEMSAIIGHPDVQRMLMTMRALTAAARTLCLMTAIEIDRSHRLADETARKIAAERAGLLTPLAKAFSTDIANEVASLGVQVHGGMGFIEETGAAQFMRDARIAAIYEGTNGIQAIDLVQRKLTLSGGDAMKREMATMRAELASLKGANAEPFGGMALRLGTALDALERASGYMVEKLSSAPADAMAGATPYLRLFSVARAGLSLGTMALAAQRLKVGGDTDPAHASRIAMARFFADHVASTAPGLETSVTQGAASIHDASFALAG